MVVIAPMSYDLPALPRNWTIASYEIESTVHHARQGVRSAVFAAITPDAAGTSSASTS